MKIFIRTKLVGNIQVIYHFKPCKLENSKYNLFCEIFRFHNSNQAIMNLAKYIVAHNLARFKVKIFLEMSKKDTIKIIRAHLPFPLAPISDSSE